jgi:hypothetical protein
MFQSDPSRNPTVARRHDPGESRAASAPRRSFRPSLLDPRFTGDPWIVGHDDGTAVLCLDGYQLTRICLLRFDLPSFNRVFGRLRQGRRRSSDPCR